jgi:hypothetical protein
MKAKVFVAWVAVVLVLGGVGKPGFGEPYSGGEVGGTAAKGRNDKSGVTYFGDLPGTGEGNGAEVALYQRQSLDLLKVTVWIDATGPHLGEFYGYRSGDSLPLGARSASGLAGREFKIEDGRGRTIVSSRLPKLSRSDHPKTFGGPITRGEPPFVLFIADRNKKMQEIATLQIQYRY